MIQKSCRWAVVFLFLCGANLLWADEKAYSGITSSELQAQVNTLPKQGYRPTEIKGYAHGNEARFDITWNTKPGPNWIMHHNMSADKYNTQKEDLKLTGYQIKRENAYRLNGITQYIAIWEQGQGANLNTQTELPKFTWLNKTQKGFIQYSPAPGCEVTLFALTWDGSMKHDVCQQVYSHVLNAALTNKTSLVETTSKGKLNDKLVYFFGYYNLHEKKGDWIAVFPGLRTSNGAAAGCEAIRSNGERFRTTNEERLVWRLTNGQAVILRYQGDHTGFWYRMIVNDPDIKIRDK